MPTINWYPGHIAKAERKLKELAGLVDVAIIIIDSRIPLSSYYDNLEDLIGEMPQLLLLNKADLADPACTSLWKEAFESFDKTALIWIRFLNRKFLFKSENLIFFNILYCNQH